jgi:type IV secretion system protein VirB10
MSEHNPPSPVDDGRSPVAGARGREMSMGTKLGILGLVGIIILAFVWFNAFYSHKAKGTQAQAAVYGEGGEVYTPPPPTVTKPVPVALPAPAAQPSQGLGFNNQPQQFPASAPILAYSGSESAVPAATPAVAPAATQPAPSNGQTLGTDNSPLAQKLKPTVLSSETASVIQNPDMVITEGTMIPCVLQTAIDSTLPGLVTCVVPIDIRGTTGNVVLIDRGTKIVGQIQSGLLQGQNRVFVDWTRAETPAHVIVTLDSPGSDELGRGGLPGAVNNHFWDRFGGALMLTLVQGALDAATIEAAGKGGTNSTTQQAGLGFVYAAQSNGQEVANTALQNSINIPPTLTKNQGDTVSLIVAHDLDFSGVYQLRVNNGVTDAGYGG